MEDYGGVIVRMEAKTEYGSFLLFIRAAGEGPTRPAYHGLVEARGARYVRRTVADRQSAKAIGLA